MYLGARFGDCACSRWSCLPRSLPHHSIVMLCMLVTILSLAGVAGQGRGLRQRYVHLLARLCIDAPLGPTGSRMGICLSIARMLCFHFVDELS